MKGVSARCEGGAHMEYEFTNEWFTPYAPLWKELAEWIKPARALEIGSYEGQSACFLIEQMGGGRPSEIHCIDTWGGSVEHAGDDMGAVEARFDRNIKIALQKAEHPVDFHKHRGSSQEVLPTLLTTGFRDYFDLIYVDGSHQAPDVLFDAINSFALLKPEGLLIFDDYIWQMEPYGEQDHYNMPKPAIDAFFNIYRRKLKPVMAPLYQLYMLKLTN